MAALSKKLIKEFFGYCAWVNTVWKMKRIIYDDNPKLELLFSKSYYPYFLSDVGQIMSGYVILSVTKLHDPAVDSRGNTSLTLEYMVKFGTWNTRTRTRLEKLKAKLDSLAEPLKAARNKILAHRDIKAIEDGKALGRFGKQKSMRYFNLLQRFVNIIGRNTGFGIYPFNNAMPINDAIAFRDLTIQDTEERNIMGWPDDYAKTPDDMRQLREKTYCPHEEDGIRERIRGTVQAGIQNEEQMNERRSMRWKFISVMTSITTAAMTSRPSGSA